MASLHVLHLTKLIVDLNLLMPLLSFYVVVDRIVARGTFVLNGCSLTAERCYTSLVDDGKEFDQCDSDEELDFQSLTLEVSGVKKEISKEFVKMFFTNSRISGGGDIEDIWFDKDSGKYIVTFSDRMSKQ